MAIDFEQLLSELTRHKVDFILVGGIAAIAHGSVGHTVVIDVVYRRSTPNVDRLVAALAPYKPHLRGAPPGLPFVFDRATLLHGVNFTFNTTLGDIDILGEMTGGGTYEYLLPDSVELEAFAIRCRCLNLRQLIRAKRAAGRPRDLEVIAELEAIEEVRRSS